MPEPEMDEIKEALTANDFSKARRLLETFLTAPGVDSKKLTWARQKLALSTYKDKETQSEVALEKALQALGREGLEDSTDPETLGLAGAVHKRRWEINGNVQELTWSLGYYERTRDAGASRSDLEKWAYGSVNAAFVLDLLAAAEGLETAAPSQAAVAYRNKADGFRQKVVSERDKLIAITDPEQGWWVRASLLEAYFGLDEFENAKLLLQQSISFFKPQQWQLETMAKQLASIARLRHDFEHQGTALQALSPLVSSGVARSLLIGKVGLALSGGGFRASLFHVGVLARLAELDLLRHVEVLSCVSGGSILGALYYLELRQRLQTNPDYDLSRDTFIEIVTAVQDKLLLALKRDIRTSAIMRSLWSLTTNRTILTAQMIDQALYANSNAPRRRLLDLTIVPKEETPDFHPRRDNWRRAVKAPVLILNATSLNTGHNWQFTATYMGEAPTSIEPVVDATERLRRMYYREAPRPHNETELFTAVGASTAVPGIFPPIKLKGLYPDRVVRLSDGGVHDNQGIFGLIEQDCNVMIVSDGCGQLTTETKPSWWLTQVLMRTNNVLMDAVRRNSYRILAARLRSQRIKELHFIHLKRGLATHDVTWIRGRPEDGQAVPREKGGSGLDAQTQRALAAIRTDLDCFSENECHALMFAGYRIADRDFAESAIVEASARSRPRANWKFLRVADWLDEHTASTAPKAFFEELQCGRHLFFRWLRLSSPLRAWNSLRDTWLPDSRQLFKH